MDDGIYSKEQQKLVKRLVQLRETHNYTQAALARKLNRTQSYISKLESGQRKIDILLIKKLSKIYEASMDELIST